MRTIQVEVTKMVQAAQYEPCTVRVCETIKVEDGEDVEEARLNLYKGVTKAVTKYMENELAKWATGDKKRKS